MKIRTHCSPESTLNLDLNVCSHIYLEAVEQWLRVNSAARLLRSGSWPHLTKLDQWRAPVAHSASVSYIYNMRKIIVPTS